MAKKISQLTQATEVKSDDVTVIVQDGETKKLPLNMMVTKQDVENKKIAGLAKLDEIEATYENDTYTPTITVKNKSSVKTGEGDEVDYSANVMDGHVKSAILKGNTLVNLSLFKDTALNVKGVREKKCYNKDMIKPNTNYLISYNVVAVSGETVMKIDGMNVNSFPTELGKHKMIVRTISNLTTTFPNNLWITGNSNSIEIDDFLIIEYQDGMENWDIPYFEGMQSVKMPVLTTTGKNLFDGKERLWFIEDNGKIPEQTSWRDWITDSYIQIDGGKKYYSNIINSKSFYFYDNNKNFIDVKHNVGASDVLAPINAKYMLVKIMTFKELGQKVAIYEGDFVTTTYEPYKSNILTVNEDVTLRGIGDVRDTLDCLTGQVTERIGYYKFTGDENFRVGNDYGDEISFITPTTDYMTNPYFTTSGGDNYFALTTGFKFIGQSVHTGSNEDSRNMCMSVHMSGSTYFRLRKDLLNTVDVDGFKKFIRSNPTEIVMKLSKESIKTVDLMPSGTHPSTTPYCWKNGHIQLSSSGLLPNLEYSVVTSRAGQINQNATMIVKNDKRIFDLEILLAGGLVNTTYQALTLQNQVETGLSKVSLSSETEPDYLLYHMIMKLIEEKAYKLDDLTEKVSVFYLYEKLSDEQFETIYSTLYPFVEGEIVEEPVVEELPEVVEDEVIM